MTRARRILFVGYGGGHVAMLLPVIRALESVMPAVDCQLMALTIGYLKASAVRPTLGYKDFLHLVDARAAMRWGEILCSKNFSPDVPREETVAYLGINYLDLIEQFGEEGAAERYQKEGRQGFFPLHFMRRLMSCLQPDAVVATNSPRSERAALEVARELGIPSVGMVDLFGLDSDTYVTRSIKPDWTCVISDAVRERLLCKGFSPQEVVVTGNPAFDGMFSESARHSAQEFIQRLGWQGLSPILWVGHKERNPNSGLDDFAFPCGVEEKLRWLVRHDPDLALIIRYHPTEWHEFPRMPDESRVYFSIPSRDPIHPVLLASSLVVVQNSTVGLEAAVAGRPVISLEHAPSIANFGSFSLQAMGVSRGCYSNDDLPELVKLALRSSLRVESDYQSDGRSAARVASVVRRAVQ